MIQGLSDFKWPRPIATDPSTRDRSRRCVFHKDHGHTTEMCRSFQYLVERLIKARHLKQYLRTDTGGGDVSQHNNSGAPRAQLPPRPLSTILTEDHLTRSMTPGGKGRNYGTIIFPPVDPTRTLQPHRDALILSLEIGDFDVRRILVDPGSSADLVQTSVVGRMGHSLAGLENPGRILSGFNGSSTTSLGDIILPVQAGPFTLNVQFSVVQELSPFNVILGRAWLHYMKAIPSTYHQMESDHLTNISSLMTQEETQGMQNILRQNHDIFAPVRQRIRRFHPERQKIIRNEIDKLLKAGFIREVSYPDWLANVVVVPKKKENDRVCVDYTNLNNACPKDSFPLPRIDQIVDSTSGQGMLSFLDAFSGYHQIPMSPDDEEKTAFITPHDLYCYKVMPFGLKNAGATYQRLMTKIFKPLIGHSVELNPSKCAFGVSAGKFLGFMVSQRGIEVSPDQVKAVWKHLPGTRRIQRLTGKLVALGRFIARFTMSCDPSSWQYEKLERMGGRTVAKALWKGLSIVLCNHPS
ncbi:Transposon Ty3-I Gag-Pol polyprotein [Vitis vinifera]|uniref:Transposon Ty3-I Gag-Pol polyprotein n=1 Tax=Vitis vinifera TaxID=29760 RepID=A0A438EFZ6_VITVI|nr:Transposon Ty3-I Gag-Pol polyprotein [Vitis vinifera]